MSYILTSDPLISSLTVEAKNYSLPSNAMLDHFIVSLWSREEEETYAKGRDRIINLFKSFPDQDMVLTEGTRSLVISFKKRTKSHIPFLSHHSIYKTVEILFDGTRYSKKRWVVNHYAKTKSNATEENLSGTVEDFQNKYTGPAYPKLILEEKIVVDQVLDELEKIYRPNSIDFLMGD